MDKIIMKYNPAFWLPEELVASFVVRYGELETIMRTIKENVTKSNQHILVIGPRGIGKTMLVLRAAEEIRRDKELNEKWYPLVFSEESYQVSTCGEFWLEALFHLGQQTKDEHWQKTFEELRDEKDEKRLRERALAQLMDFADEQKKRLLLVVENLNMLLGDQLRDEDGWALRHTLQNEQRIMLLASATSRFEQVDVEGKPMFELFRFVNLKPLDEAECRALWAFVTDQKPNDRRMRPLKILTGGNPRLLAIVSNFAAKMSLKELMSDLMRLVDEQTEYFKSHLDNLPAVERKVYIALAEIWDPATARKVAETARLDVNKTSSLLARLIERGAVVEANGKARSKLYQVAERMYNIYYLMRRRGATSERVKALVHFMVSFYGPGELVEVVKGIAEEACGLTPTERTDHYMAYVGVFSKVRDESVLYKIFGSTPRSFFEGSDIPISLKKLFEGFEQTELPRRIIDLHEKSESIRNNPKELEKEEKYFRDFVRDHPKNYGGLVGLGTFLRIFTNNLDEAEKIYREAVRIAPKEFLAWLQLGSLLVGRGHFEEAEQAFSKAVEFSLKHKSEYWLVFGGLCQTKGRLDIAERAYRKAIELNPKDKDAWFALGTLLGKYIGNYDDSVDALEKVVNIDPNSAAGWNNLGLALENSRKFEEAEEAFREAIKLEKEPAYILANLGGLFILRGQDEDGEKWLREALKKDSNLYTAAGSLGVLLINNDLRRNEGFEILRELTKNPEVPKNDIDFATELIVSVAAFGYGREAIDILKESPWAGALEPVVVALRLILGEDVKAAAEIMEVAKDVVKRIEELRKKIGIAKKGNTKE
jgi:tetratricopeptide (TPR) repeat protein